MVSAPLPFRRWETPAGLAPSLIFEDGVGPGIYVLEFSNGDQYVGQSIHPATRFASHRRRWQDIVAVNFTPVPPEELDRVEQAMITEKRRADVRLRNRTLLAQPFGDSPLDFIVTQEEQAAWIGDDPMNVEREIAPQRIVEARARRRTDRGRLPEPVREHPHLAEAVDSIAGYLYYVIPLPTETEGRGWVLSAWPSTNRARSHRRFATLSIQKVEMLYLYEARTEDGEWEQTMVLNVHDSLEIDDELRPLFFQTAYRTTGPVWTTAVHGWEDIGVLLGHPAVLLAARKLALSQLRKGRAMFSRAHSWALADAAFAHIGDVLDDWATAGNDRAARPGS
ncbi:GIY-YIG nuclease family protein [Micrococcus yunnanensis]|uniref:GIY-YIG nuclease family protein n=1 Tax=Micrococcus yunnanensis TaxID=566027 RepID=UPI003015136C